MDSKAELDTLLINHFSSRTVTSIVAQPLCGHGQFFTSYIQKMKVFLEEDSKKSQIDLVIKTLPSTEKEIETNSKLKFMKEINFYQLALPEYHRIQADHKLPEENLFPLFYTASEEIIILEDLYSNGYFVCDSFLNKAQSELVLRELAMFHATGIALKVSNPTIFEERLASVVIPALRNASNPDRDEINMEFISEINKLLGSNDGLKDFAETVDLILSRIDNTKLPAPSEPFSTLLHNDLWRGNVMFKYSCSNAETLTVKFIDFQTVIFNSPARDLISFLFSSVEDSVLCEFSDLLKFYHHHFVNYLSDFGVDSSKFSFEKLMFEINCYGPSKLKHILLLFKVLCSGADGNSNFEQYLQRVVTLFRDRGWLKNVCL